jgi:hypothetical protein
MQVETTPGKLHIGLVSCGAHKQAFPAPAEFLYTSELFRRSRAFALRTMDRWFILSAKHGLLSPEEIVPPYDEALSYQQASKRAAWARAISEKLDRSVARNALLVLLAGGSYREPLERLLVTKGYECVTPLEGLSIEQQLQWLERAAKAGDLFHNIRTFYLLLAELRSANGQFVKLAELHYHQVPKKGVYFFFDPDESSRFTGLLPRLVRIGTHGVSVGSRATLWQRLRTHRGTGKTAGDHRSSVFRLHVGTALLAREGRKLSSWGKRRDARPDVRHLEASVEREVTKYLGRLLVAHIEVPDAAGPKSDRSYIERNAIALMSSGGSALDAPGANWLGANSPIKADFGI